MNVVKKNGNPAKPSPKKRDLYHLFTQMIATLNDQLVEREEVVRGCVLALLARKHVFMLSEPGTAKSVLAMCLTKAFTGAAVFVIQLDKQTRKEQFYGPVDLDKYIGATGNGHKDMVLMTDGYAADAHIILADEIWKANSSILDCFLMHFAEDRLFKNGRQLVQTPLITVICCSNELPEDSGLKAHYDRIMLRFVLDDIQDDANFIKASDSKVTGCPGIMTLDELKAAQAEVDAVVLKHDIKVTVASIRRKLMEAGIKLSMRRWNESYLIMRASAWLDGRAEVNNDDIEILKDVAWNKPDDRKAVNKVVMDVVNPALTRALEIFDMATEINAEACRHGDDDAGKELNAKFKKLLAELRTLPKSRKVQEIDEKMNTMLKNYLTLLGYEF